jgi:predicted amidohydrolase
MFPFYPYEQCVTPGDEFVVFDVPGIARVGVSICYDMWFPETTRTLAWMGAEVILHPTMTNTIDRDVELAIARASAATNQCWFVDINVAGDLGFGRSGIYGPGGEILHEAGSGREVLAAELDIADVRRARDRGWHGITQTLKSFRDSRVRFPPYLEGHDRSAHLQALGPLSMPRRDDPDSGR